MNRRRQLLEDALAAICGAAEAIDFRNAQQGADACTQAIKALQAARAGFQMEADHADCVVSLADIRQRRILDIARRRQTLEGA